MSLHREKGIYVGRFKLEGEWEYRTAYVEDVNRTIPDYGINKDWTEAQQVLSYSVNFCKKIDILKKGEVIFYDTEFPKMTMREATEIIIGYEQ